MTALRFELTCLTPTPGEFDVDGAPLGALRQRGGGPGAVQVARRAQPQSAFLHGLGAQGIHHILQRRPA